MPLIYFFGSLVEICKTNYKTNATKQYISYSRNEKREKFENRMELFSFLVVLFIMLYKAVRLWSP